MSVQAHCLEIGKEVIRKSVLRGCQTLSATEVGHMVRPDLPDSRALTIGRAVAGHIGEATRGAKDSSLYAQAMALGIQREVFIGWLREATDEIMRVPAAIYDEVRA
jgi:hypothetical protein